MVNITSPKVYDTENNCQVPRTDSIDYIFSIGGYDPCFYLDFTQSHIFKFKIACESLKEDFQLGYKYQNIIKTEPIRSLKNSEKISYPKDKAWVIFDFRDWKWISNFKRYQVEIQDVDVLNGLKEGKITVDLNQIVQSDKTSETKFEM